MTAHVWTQEEIDMLRRLAAEGLTGGKIAERLTETFKRHFTRNSIIGKTFREGIQLQGSYKEGAHVARMVRRVKEGKTPRAPRLKPVFVAAPPPALEIVPEVTVSLEDLGPGMCRWPFGNGPFQFCGCPAAPGKSYCETHHAKAWRPPNRTAERTKWNFARRTSTEAKVNA